MSPHVRQHPSTGACSSPRPRQLSWLLLLASCACDHTAVSQHAGTTPASLSAHRDRIQVSAPSSGAVVRSPLRIAGEARGNWFFEASFPVLLLDAERRVLALGIAQAQGEWMTQAFVPFSAELVFVAPPTADGTLVLERDNPSGLPEHADRIEVPVRFVATPQN